MEEIVVFDSQMRECSQPNEATNVMFGVQSAYHFAKGQLMEKNAHSHGSPYRKENVQSYTFLKNHLFVLLKDFDGSGSDVPTKQPLAMHYIKEYAVEYHPQHLPT